MDLHTHAPMPSQAFPLSLGGGGLSLPVEAPPLEEKPDHHKSGGPDHEAEPTKDKKKEEPKQ